MTDPLRIVLPGEYKQLHLTGFMGSGKSTVGRLIARRLLWNFLDLDGVVERHDGRRVQRIFEEDGEEAFRAAERFVLRQVIAKPSTVVALGGGTLIDVDNQEVCRDNALLVWLRCPLEVLQARVGESPGRPLWGDRDELSRRYEERLPGFESAAHAVDATGLPEAVADAVLRVAGLDDQ